MHIQDFAEQRWIQSKVEGAQPQVPKERKQRIVERLNAAEAFEKFLATKYVGDEALWSGRCRVGDPDPRSDPVDGRRRRARFGGDRHGPPRPVERACQCDRQELRPDLQRVRGSHRPELGAGFRRREVPPRCYRQVRESYRCRHPCRTRSQSEPPRDRRSDRARHDARRTGSNRTEGLVSHAAHPDSRRRRVRRPGPGRRVLGDERHQGLSRRRHCSPHHQQPDRLHHQPAVCA